MLVDEMLYPLAVVQVLTAKCNQLAVRLLQSSDFGFRKKVRSNSASCDAIGRASGRERGQQRRLNLRGQYIDTQSNVTG